MAHHEELPYWLALRRAGLGSTNFSLLLRHFRDLTAAWQADLERIAAAGLDPQYVRAVAKARATFDADRELRALEEHDAHVTTWLDAEYPASLRTIPQSPPVLFWRGSLAPELEPAVAVVGTRHVTPYGRQATEAFVEGLAGAGVAIISGLARGVDAIAHRIAVERRVPTVAVLAGGIDQVFPRENIGLADRVREHGCLVSEYPVGIPARPDYFPRRNRIIAGLARATLIVEAGHGSGALHTANWAFEQGRDVYAVPGSIFSRQSAGTNQLIREHTARLVATPEQLLQELNLAAAQPALPLQPEPALPMHEAKPAAAPAPPFGVDTEEEAIYRLLGPAPLHVDEVARAAGLPVARVSAALQLLELMGRVHQPLPLTYARA